MKSSRIQAIDHIHIESGLGSEDELRWFYGEVCGLAETAGVVGPTHLMHFRSAMIELHVRLVERPDVDPMIERVSLAVTSLAAAREMLEERKRAYEFVQGLGYTDRRVVVHDPGGNRVALKQYWPEMSF